MAVSVGFQGHLGLRKESSLASGGAIDNWQPFTSESLELSYNNVYSDKVQATPEQVGGQRGNEVVTGNITFPLSPQNPAQWWTCGLGQDTSPYYVERPLKSLMLQIDKEAGCIQASGCMINTMTFSSSQGGELACSADIEGVGMASCTVGVPSFTATDAPYLHQEASFRLNGTADTSVTAFSVALANNVGTDLFGTNRVRLDIPAGKLVVTGSFTKLFDDVTERDAFLASSVRSFQVDFARNTKSFTIYCPKIRYNTRPANIGGQSEFIMETFNFTAFVDDPATEKSIRISGDVT